MRPEAVPGLRRLTNAVHAEGLMTGDAPTREFAAVFPQPLRTGMQFAGGRFLRSAR